MIDKKIETVRQKLSFFNVFEKSELACKPGSVNPKKISDHSSATHVTIRL